MEVENNQQKSWGGARPGAGRKPGSLNSKTRAIAEKCADMGATPLEVMVQAYLRFGEVKTAVDTCVLLNQSHA